MSEDEDRDEEINELLQGFYNKPISDESLNGLLEGLQKFYPGLVLEDKHIEALKELHGATREEAMRWRIKHNPKDAGMFLSSIYVDVEEGQADDKKG